MFFLNSILLSYLIRKQAQRNVILSRILFDPFQVFINFQTVEIKLGIQRNRCTDLHDVNVLMK